MVRYLDKYLWAVLLVIAVGVSAACSNSTTTDDTDSGTAPDALTQG
jgi:hypothetical protein